MADILGLDTGGLGVPKIEIASFLSSTWIWVLVVALIGVALVGIVAIILYYMTYNKKVVLFENIAGQGYQPIMRTRARTLKIHVGGLELLKTLKGGHFLSAYGRKMGKNTYWFCKGQDGYWYNSILGDLDAKMGMLDIEPIDRDVRMFHVAIDRLSNQTYGKNSFMEKYGIHMMLFLFLIVLVLGMWFIVGKIGDATAPLAQSGDIAIKVSEQTEKLIARLDSVVRAMNQIPESTIEGGSGLVPAT